MNPVTPAALKPLFSIRFPLRKQRVKEVRYAIRYRTVVALESIPCSGRPMCAARMISCALRHREEAEGRAARIECGISKDPILDEVARRLSRLSMRESALWARRFAKGIADDDKRWAELEKQYTPLRQILAERRRSLDPICPIT